MGGHLAVTTISFQGGVTRENHFRAYLAYAALKIVIRASPRVETEIAGWTL
ncbi:hypothetical protein GCM10007907_40150 [Chitinimonas prasina]|uniref:Uncharacterized protein n=1 Tax=Chitinimonas prasina TaxID=1434937 RepID=A0ABQ5YJP4_9NEIS|nr:hypothetical protein GCM10007907_40150 [Chitinimonas prasina]